MQLNLKEKQDGERVLVGVHVYQDTKDALQDLAAKNGISLANVLRTAINNLIDSECE